MDERPEVYVYWCPVDGLFNFSFDDGFQAGDGRPSVPRQTE